MIYNGREVIFIDYEYDQIASFSLPDGLIGISVSGGLDSTTLLYAICQYITDLDLEEKIEILPLHIVDKYLSNSLAITQQIVKDTMERYPNVKIKELEVGFYDGGMFKIVSDDERKFRKSSTSRKFYKKMNDKHNNLKFIMKALTAAPSYKITKNWKCSVPQNRANKLFSIDVYNEDSVHIFRPFVFCDKKIVFNIFNYLNLPKKYLTDTWSCTMYEDRTKNFTEPCKMCYNCHEKKWAFGQF